MVRIDFPLDLTGPEFQDCLIRENMEDFITKVRVIGAQTHDRLKRYFNSAQGPDGPTKADKIQDFFAALGLEEKETLNGVAKAGSCQFSCLADQLYGRECTKDWRPDILLRKLALYVIATNEDEFRSFMLHANPKTRRQNKTAGESVDIEGYVNKMTSNSTDGDHLTLQALCDALQCPIHIVQLVDHPRAEKITMAHLSVKSVVVNDLHPRTLPHLHPKTARLQIQRRELWLTLHGEAHFRSLHSTNFSEEEAHSARNELIALQSSLPDPPPTPTNHRYLPPPPTPPSETCSICFQDVVVVRQPRVLVQRDEEPVRPNTCSHVFHLACLEQWVKLNNSCPNCKTHLQSLDRLLGGKPIVVVDKRKGPRGNYNHLGRSGAFDNRSFYEGEEGEEENEEGIASDDSTDDPADTIRCYMCDHANHSSVLLLCDGPGCPRSAHTWCVGLASVPRGQWYCDVCTRRATSRAAEADAPLDLAQGGGSTLRLTASIHRPTPSRGRRRSSSAMRPNPLATEISQRHAADGISSTLEWTRVLDHAQRADDHRRRMLLLASQPVDPPLASSSAAAPPPTAQDDNSRRALEAREAALLSIPLPNGHPSSSSSPPASHARRPRRAYEISSDSDSDAPANGGALKSEHPPEPRTHNTPSADNPQAPATEQHPPPAPRPANKRPRVVIPPPPPLPSSASSSAPRHGNVDVRGMIAGLERAADADVESVARGWPPTEIARAQADLSAIFLWDQRDQARILNAGLLKVLRRCLDPVPGRSVIPAHIKAVIFRLLQVLPIGMNHLRDSGINRVLLEICSKPGETRANRQLVQTLIGNWSRFVYNVTGNGAVHVHSHKGRYSPYSPPHYPLSSSSSSSHHTAHASASGPSSNGMQPERLFNSRALSPLRPFP